MGSKGGGSQTSSTVSSLPPEVLANYQDVVNQAKNVSSTPYQQYTGQLVAPLNSTQQQATTNATNAQGAYLPYFNQAQNYASQGTQGITPSTIDQTAIDKYRNPYTQDVINSTLANTNIEDAKQQSALQGNAIARGAWGGDRADLARNDLARNQALARNQTIAGLENQGYSQALGEANTQQQTGMAAQQANAANALQASGLTGALGNYAQNNQLQGASALMAAGQIGQQTQQNQNTAAYQQFQQQLAYPFQNTQYLANIIEGLGNQGGTSTTTQPNQSPNSILGFLGLKTGGAVEGYAPGGMIDGMPDWQNSYVPVAQNSNITGTSIPNAPTITNPKQPQANLSDLISAGKGISTIGGYLGQLAPEAGYAANAMGAGNAAYDAFAASDAAAAAGSSAGWLDALMAFMKTGGAVKGYANAGAVMDLPPMLPNSGISGYSNESPLFSTVDKMSVPQNFTPAPDFSKGYVPVAQPQMSSMASPSSIPVAPAINNPQEQPIQQPQALSDLQSELAQNAPVLDKDAAIWTGIAGAMAGKNRGILQNVGEGLGAGLKTYAGQKQAVAEYALKQAEAEKRAEQLAIEANRYNKMLQIEQEKVDQGKFSLVPGMGKDAKGNDVAGSYKLNAKTGEQEFLPGVVQSQKANVPPATGTNRPPELSKLTGDEFIDGLSKSVNPDYANEIKSLADTGNIPSPKTGRYDNSQMLEDIYRYKGDASSASKTAITRFDSGVNANQIRFNSTAMTHLDTLAQAAQALKNNDTQALNKMQNTFKTQFGSSAPTNFNAARDLAAGEIVKAITQTGGTLEDRKNAEQNISNAESPEQLAGVINTYQTMLGGQLYNQFLEYKSSTGQSDKKFMDKLDTSAKGQMQSIMAQHKGATSSRPSDEDLAFTAKKHGMTVEQVKAKLGIQ